MSSAWTDAALNADIGRGWTLPLDLRELDKALLDLPDDCMLDDFLTRDGASG